MPAKNVWAVIPAHNEEKNVGNVIASVKRHCNNIVLVDDGSCDNTALIGEKAKIIVLKHIVNLGKGCALKTGCDFVVSHGAEIIIAIDADAQHDPNEIPNFVRAIVKDADIVFGYRKFNKNMPFILKIGNWGIGLFVKLFYNINLRDTQCGYRAFTSNAYRIIRWCASDYSMESEVIANVGRYGLKYTEIPIQTIYSDKYKGTTVLDGIKIVVNMLFWRLRWF